MVYSHMVGDAALVEMERYTNIPYPLSKLDHLVVPSYAFPAMEHWGMITYR